jgi:putative sterol carrier protein
MPLTVNEIFNALPERFNPEAAGDWTAKIQFNFGEDEDSWFIDVADGSINVGQGTVEDATATVTTTSDTWVGLVTGEVNGMMAMMSGKLQIAGNMGHVMKLQDRNVFGR